MSDPTEPNPILASNAPERIRPSNYPEPFASRMQGRKKHPLGDLFHLKNLGVNLVRLPPGSLSALHHAHSRQDEFIYILEGHPTLLRGDSAVQLAPGMIAGFPSGGLAHHLENRSDADCVILEVGDRSPSDNVSYPSDDIQAIVGVDGQWHFTHKDGRPYQ
ncbi:cupin domain-containing protein [Pseudomonas sp. dw_358]|uniref:cupin domain-containing protein n=1 Tax=Pseudomonas sp. dw_358 TaxID=2720083 RepID=UPI001BD54CE0|nr:cupin domain-containing protein [Pseudomonas sp. dw_358]